MGKKRNKRQYGVGKVRVKYGVGFPAKYATPLVELRDRALVCKKVDWIQLGHSTAWYGEFEGKYVLKSYNDIVAIFTPDDNSIFVFGRYSVTTYRHIRKFYVRCLEIIYPSINMYNLELDDYYLERS